MKIKKGDNVILLAGKDKGKTGKVLKTFPVDEKVIIDGLNMVKKHQRARKQGEKGQIISIPSLIHVSNVSIIDPKTKKPARIGYKIEDDKKIRISKKTGEKID